MISFKMLLSTSPHSPLWSWHHQCLGSSPDPQQQCCCWTWCLEIKQKIAKYVYMLIDQYMLSLVD